MFVSLRFPCSDLDLIVLTLRCLDANLLESLRLLHRPYNSLDQLLNLLVQTTNICVLLRRLLIDLHGLDSAVVFRGKCVQNEI